MAGEVALKPKLDILAEQKQAVRGILYLYWELATNWGGINGEAEFGGFDRWRWLQCEADYDGGVWRSYDDTLLLRQGSAVALLCEMNNEWDHYDEVEEQVWRVALEAGRFDHLPEARRAVEAGLKGEKQLYEELPVVYDGYVLAFFEMLVREGGHRRSTRPRSTRPRSTRPRSSPGWSLKSALARHSATRESKRRDRHPPTGPWTLRAALRTRRPPLARPSTSRPHGGAGGCRP